MRVSAFAHPGAGDRDVSERRTSGLALSPSLLPEEPLRLCGSMLGAGTSERKTLAAWHLPSLGWAVSGVRSKVRVQEQRQSLELQHLFRCNQPGTLFTSGNF